VDPVPDPLILRKSGSAGNRTRETSGSAATRPQRTNKRIVVPKCREVETRCNVANLLRKAVVWWW
jgi:hypothetical protein